MHFTKQQIVEAISESFNKVDCIRKLGLHPTSNNSYKLLNFYASFYEISLEHLNDHRQSHPYIPVKSIPLVDILKGDYPLYASSKLRIRLIKECVFPAVCSQCFLSEWNGQPIPLELDHINGVPTDHKLSNLRLLCPNCHAQTSNYRGKNCRSKRRKNLLKQEKLDLIQKRIDTIKSANISYNKYGWATQLSKKLNISPQKSAAWVKKYMPDFYKNECFKRTKNG